MSDGGYVEVYFLEYIVKSLVQFPDNVAVVRTTDEKGILLELSVDSQDQGRIIGKLGVTAQALRTLLRAMSMKNDTHISLKILNTDRGDKPADLGE